MSNVGLDFRQGHDVVLATETDGIPGGPKPGGASNAMNVVFRILWQVVIDDMTDVLYVQTP